MFLCTMVALSGCLGGGNQGGAEPPPDPDPPKPGGGDDLPPIDPGDPPIEPPLDPFSHTIDLSQCMFMPIGTLVQSTGVEDSLPPGYRPATLIAGLVPVNLNIYACSATILNNQTVLHNVTIGHVSIAVHPDDENVTEPSYLDGYNEAIFSDHETLLNLFADVGFTTHAATFSVGLGGTTVTASVQVGGEEWYSFQGLKSDDVRSDAYVLREHHNANQLATWFTLDLAYEFNNLVTEGVLKARHGVLHTASAGGIHASLSTQGEMTGALSFGRDENAFGGSP